MASWREREAERDAEIRRRHAKGQEPKDIAREMGVHAMTVRRVLFARERDRGELR